MNNIKKIIFHQISLFTKDKMIIINENTQLIGDILDSMKLVELCIKLEDISKDMGFEFNWTSEKAMSKSLSMFRTAGSLSNEFIYQMETKK